MTSTGFLHPGAMGASLAGICAGERLWASEGRSTATRARALEADATDVGALSAMTDRADVIVAVCPPAEAVAVADAVASAGFGGIYVDANAISPATSRAIGERFEHFVDGGIIGPPVRGHGSTRLYLAGDAASKVARRWSGSPLEVRVVDGPPGAASAVKMGFAAWTKGTAALLLAIRAMAEAEGVTPDLVGEWETSMPHLLEQASDSAPRVSQKAWRFAGEMEEIASTFADAGLPDGFHQASAEIYRRLSGFKNADPGPSLDEVIKRLE